MDQCNRQQGFTACGVDQLLVVCTYNPEEGSKCLHDFGPCEVGKARGGSVGECQGRSQYVSHLPSEKTKRPTHEYRHLRAALSIAVEALCTMTYDSFNERDTRGAYYLDTLKAIRAEVGDIRLTTLSVECAWCDPPRMIGEKEGNGAVGVTSTICPNCLKKQLGENVPLEVRRIAAAIGLAIGDVKDDAEARKGIAEIYEDLERGKPAEVAASTGSV